MDTGYAEALGWLYAHEGKGIDLSLDRMRAALASRGHPERAFRVVHVAGTNGKGSVSATIERVLRATGRRTGLYTSPHLHRFAERIRVDGAPVDDARVAAGLEAQRQDAALPPLTFFERATLLAFEIFRDAGVDIAVVEVGLGGRLDATNVVRPDVSVITHVAMDHEAYLGDTLADIAREKAGIIRVGAPVITSTRGEARDVVVRTAHARMAPCAVIDDDFGLDAHGFEGLGVRVDGVAPALPGAHQLDNLACAIAALVTLRRNGLYVPDAAIREGVADVRWPGRLEHVVREGSPAFLLDAAHNPDGCAALAAHLRSLPRKRTVLLMGVMRDKAFARMLEAFDDVVDARVYAAPAMPRAASPHALADVRAGEVAASLDDGLARVTALAGADGRVVVAGSIFVLAHVRAALLGVASDPPIGL